MMRRHLNRKDFKTDITSRLTMNIITCRLHRLATYASNDEPFKLYHQALGNGDLRISDAPHHDYSEFGKWLDNGELSSLPSPPLLASSICLMALSHR